MDSFKELFKKEHKGEFILIVLMIIYLILGLKTPDLIANLIDNLVGKVVIILIVIYLFMHANPILAVLAALVAFDLIRRSSATTGISALQKYAPSEEKKMSQFTAFNQFPYTLEQEVVAKMAPIVRSGSSLNKASYKPLLDNLYDAASLNTN
jgi:ABC-type multidrug transport system fused ATPase/permease subunit